MDRPFDARAAVEAHAARVARELAALGVAEHGDTPEGCAGCGAIAPFGDALTSWRMRETATSRSAGWVLDRDAWLCPDCQHLLSPVKGA